MDALGIPKGAIIGPLPEGRIMREAGYRWRVVVLSLLACLVLAGCAARDASSTDEKRNGEFYGGVFGGRGM